MKEQSEPEAKTKQDCVEIPAELVSLGQMLGRGTFCEVYEAHYLGTRVAFKKFNRSKEQNIRAFEKEREILHKYRHPNII